MKTSSPYLSHPQRLADVIAAIQVMATYKFYKLGFEEWADRISADTSKSAYWKAIFEEHPEFFRLNGEKTKASLVWRRQFPRRYHVDREIRLSKDEYDTLAIEDKNECIFRSKVSHLFRSK